MSAEALPKVVHRADPDLKTESIPVNETEQAYTATTAGTSVTISKGTDSHITVSDDEGSLALTMPSKDDPGEPELLTEDMVAYGEPGGTTTVASPRKDGSLQLHVVIPSPSSPKEYAFAVSASTGARPHMMGDSVVFVDPDGSFAGALAPAWAKDATGRDVPTHFTISPDGRFTQVVEHDASFSYPIVADPWLGKNLFGGFTTKRKTYKGKKVYSAALNSWGWSVYTGAAGSPLPVPGPLKTASGYKIIREAGWKEWKTHLVGQNPPISVEQQYVCHARFGYAFWKAGFHWDLELARPSKPDWTKNPWRHKCNW